MVEDVGVGTTFGQFALDKMRYFFKSLLIEIDVIPSDGTHG